jgi:hypothetical protein
MFGTLVCSLTHFVEKVPFRALFEENRKARRRMGKRELFVTYSIRLCSNCACLSHKKTPQRIEIKWRKNGGKHLVCCCLEHRTMNSTWSCAPDRLQEDCMVLRILEKNHRTMYINLSSGASVRPQQMQFFRLFYKEGAMVSGSFKSIKGPSRCPYSDAQVTQV